MWSMAHISVKSSQVEHSLGPVSLKAVLEEGQANLPKKCI